MPRPSVPPGERLAALVALRPRDAEGFAAAVSDQASRLPGERRYPPRREITRRFGAAPRDLARLEELARRHRLRIVSVRRSVRLVELAGDAASFERAFGARLRRVSRGTKVYRQAVRHAAPPRGHEDYIEAIFGLDDLPRFRREERSAWAIATRADAPDTATVEEAVRPHPDPAAIARRYRFPEALDGSGQTIAVLLLGGGFHRRDIADFFARAGQPPPRITLREIAGQKNRPAPVAAIRKFVSEISRGEPPSGDPELVERIWWSIEATVDLELAGSFAPGAALMACFAPPDERGKLEALATILTERRRPSVVSCSWGMRESDARPAFLATLDRLFAQAALLGVTICYSSGDKGGDRSGGDLHVHFPASSPLVLACGGTALGPAQPAAAEAAWNESRSSRVLATGGGFSAFFARPGWQPGAQRPSPATFDGRAVPDVAAKADYASGYENRIAGISILGGGTSAAVPLWAGLLARLNQALGVPAGWITPLLYRPELARGLTDVTRGATDAFRAARGWDACTGLGCPIGADLVAALTGNRRRRPPQTGRPRRSSPTEDSA